MFTCRDNGPGIVREPFRPAAGDRVLQGLDHTLSIKVSSRETRGRCAVMECEAEPEAYMPPHVHHREDEILCVVRGRFAVTVGGETREAVPGDFVFAPRGVAHAWRYLDTGKKGCFQVIITPGGMEEMFVEIDAVRRGGGSDGQPSAALLAQLCDIATRYDVTFLLPEAAEEVAAGGGIGAT